MSNVPDQSIPPFNVNIQSTPVTAIPRKLKAKLKAKWGAEAADDLRSLWGISPISRPDNTLDLLQDALEDPNYDPDAPEGYKGLWRWPDGRVATPEEIKEQGTSTIGSSLVETMADEIKAEIDQEILRDLVKLAQK